MSDGVGLESSRAARRWERVERAGVVLLVAFGASLAVVTLIHLPINRAIEKRPEGMPRSWALGVVRAEAWVIYPALFLGVVAFPIVAAFVRRRLVLVVAGLYPLAIGALVVWGVAHDIAAGP
ncbi:hypothetical protein [Tsukamurella pseudospumae]|uniref:Bacitracin resistance protein n=1 Tax=Tsukamurella pseudospumae TaxID=239498 RepID=A0A137Z7Z1_9ACTN|nr:hypothetical protein [Tsukamurella pseudospumae]KXO94306.1 hypothetical protein AXK61_23815 [Tsukamurella pseudospumae]